MLNSATCSAVNEILCAQFIQLVFIYSGVVAPICCIWKATLVFLTSRTLQLSNGCFWSLGLKIRAIKQTFFPAVLHVDNLCLLLIKDIFLAVYTYVEVIHRYLSVLIDLIFIVIYMQGCHEGRL